MNRKDARTHWPSLSSKSSIPASVTNQATMPMTTKSLNSIPETRGISVSYWSYTEYHKGKDNCINPEALQPVFTHMMKKFAPTLKATIINVTQDTMASKKETKFKGSFLVIPVSKTVHQIDLSHILESWTKFIVAKEH